MFDRRKFIKISGAALSGALLFGCGKSNANGDGPSNTDDGKNVKPGGSSDAFGDYSEAASDAYFSLTQLTSSTDNIGNSYILVTGNGKVIVMDGGLATDESHLRAKIAEVGNHVDAWFVSHPHGDHVGAVIPILENRKGIVIDKLYHSRLNTTLQDAENGAKIMYATPFYNALDNQTGTEVINVQTTGQVYDIDGVKIKVLGIANPEFKTNAYNNASMVLKVWDATKSVLFLGDAGEECGEKLLKAFPNDLSCDYIQMAHHGQQGCNEKFYKTVNFSACLWPTPSWLWKAGESSQYKTWETRRWMDEKGITEHHVSCLERDWKLV